jgi:isopentenyl diphosphate isomerase/L-lactate dehydrogenase-like FMN-dependent dehydrogenase
MAASGGPEPLRFVTVDDYEPAARDVLPRETYDYYAGGAGDELTLADNRRSFDRWLIRPRFLRGSGSPDTSTSLVGTPLSFPVVVAPWAYQRLAHPDGEPATARAAARAGTVMCVSTTTVDYLEEVAAATTGPKWWQLYVFSDHEMTVETLKRVAAGGFAAIVWTVDFPVAGLRHRDTRNGFMMPIGLPTDDLLYDPDLTWDDLAWIRSLVPDLPVLVKGLLTADDARLALEAGADGIVVSNLGGRQLDSSPAALDALTEIVEAVAGRVPLLMDGGVRRGTDVLKALALGATAVMVGRPTAWGLAVAGEDGVADVLRILHDEFTNAMALAGCRTVGEITRAHVTPRP